MLEKHCVKGHHIVLAKKYLINRFGPQAFEKIITQINPPEREILSKIITSVSWIPEDVYITFLVTADKIFGKGDFELCRQIGYYLGKETVPRLYKFFIKFGDPSFAIRRSTQFWKQLHNNGRLEIIPSGPTAVTARLIDKAFPHKAFCASLIGYCQGVLELSGAKNISIDEIQCASEGASHCEYVGKWE
jgi:predicted hydrocarbon binding protein